MRVLRTQGLESEAPLAFAALHRLLRPVLGTLDRLPAPQARALRSRVRPGGRGNGSTPFLVALATLSMLTEAAEDAPVLCVIDDAQWLDQAIADAVLVAARRLGADRVAVVFAARDGDGRTFEPDGVVPAAALVPLTGAAARMLLTEAAGTSVPDEVADRLMTETGGNPLALVELPTTSSGEQLAGAAPLPAQLHLTAGMERVFLDRCRRLPPDVQTLLLVAAADDSGQVATVASRRRRPRRRPERPRRRGTIRAPRRGRRHRRGAPSAGQVRGLPGRDQHGTPRSAPGAGRGPRRRRRPDRHAWHRAAAVDGPDEAWSSPTWSRSAARAERRGGYAAAAAAFERAAELTADEQPRAAHLFAAARNAWAAGQTTPARTLSAAARDLADDRVLRADIDRLRGRIEVNVGSGVDAHRIFTAARAVAAHDPARALEMAVAPRR